MSKGGYSGGSTVIGPRSGWFSHEAPPEEEVIRPVTIREVVVAAAETAARAEKHRKKKDAFFAKLNASPDVAKRDAINRLKRKKRKPA